MTREGDRGTVKIEVELSEPLLKLIQQAKEEQAPLSREEPKPLAEWIEEAALLRLRMVETEVPVTVDVPKEAVEQAKLHAEDRRIRTGEVDDFENWVTEFVDLQFNYDVDEDEPLDSAKNEDSN